MSVTQTQASIISRVVSYHAGKGFFPDEEKAFERVMLHFPQRWERLRKMQGNAPSISGETLAASLAKTLCNDIRDERDLKGRSWSLILNYRFDLVFLVEHSIKKGYLAKARKDEAESLMVELMWERMERGHFDGYDMSKGAFRTYLNRLMALSMHDVERRLAKKGFNDVSDMATATDMAPPSANIDFEALVRNVATLFVGFAKHQKPPKRLKNLIMYKVDCSMEVLPADLSAMGVDDGAAMEMLGFFGKGRALMTKKDKWDLLARHFGETSGDALNKAFRRDRSKFLNKCVMLLHDMFPAEFVKNVQDLSKMTKSAISALEEVMCLAIKRALGGKMSGSVDWSSM